MPSCPRCSLELRRSLVVLGLAFAGGWLGAGSVGAAPGRKPFAPADTPIRYAPARQFDLIHVKLDLAFDWEKRQVSGTATEVLAPLRSGLSEVAFHGVGLNVSRARLSGVAEDLAVSTDAAAGTIRLKLDKAYGPGDRLEIAIDYSAHPTEGLRFVGPDAGYPKKPKQIWSQGEEIDNRYWFPSWDEPGDRATSEMLATVPASWTVVGNGRLVETVTRPDGRRTFHWQMDIPHSTYLTSIVAGELVRIADAWHDIPVEYYVPPGREAQAQVSFGKTPDIIGFFSTVTGRPYPYAKYAQTAAVDFGGGMENISATTQTIGTLHDAADDEDFSSVGLVAHEAAHQWFGDLLTCRDWSEIWLNEGFASYFGMLYSGHDRGLDELDAEIDEARTEYFDEDEGDYRRPIVTGKFVDPGAMFDATTYSKGALVLHMLRGEMGDEAFYAGIRRYVERFAVQNVTTADFERTLEETSGLVLAPLFNGWVYGAGHPELAVRWEWSAEDHTARLHVEQNQEITAETGLFAFPLEIAWVGPAGVEIQRLNVEAKKAQDFVLPRSEKPDTVVVDPNGWLLAAVDFTKPAPEWIAQLKGSPSLAPKLEAVRALAKIGGTEAIGALSETLSTGRHRAFRAAAATALGDVATKEALPPLVAAIAGERRERENEARAAAAEALGKFSSHPELIPKLAVLLASDPSAKVRAAAAGALGEFVDPGDHRGEAATALLAALDRPSPREVLRGSALAALTKLGDPRAWNQALRLAAYGAPAESRGAAFSAIAELGRTAGETSGDSALGMKRKGQALRLLLGYLDDPDDRMHSRVYSALADLGDKQALGALDRAAANAPSYGQRERARKSAIKLRESLEIAGNLAERLGRLEEESGKLRRDLEALRAEREGGVQ
ncbi:MAG: M1 family aminopeptidase [Acidobacteriota bacterium]